MRLPLIVANWKMQLDDADAIATAQRLATTCPAGAAVVLCPSFTALPAIASAVRGSAIMLGAQDCAGAERGALTGEVSPEDLVHLGCRYVIVGHSERRRALGESDALVAAKLRAALAVGLHPICCVGETADEHAAGTREAVLDRQLRSTISGLELSGSQEFIVAYEPVWAIGTGHAATPDDAAAAHAFVRDVIRTATSDGTLARTRVLYGGSVTPENVAMFLATPGVDGVLVGTASQTAARFRTIVHAAVGG